MHLQWDNGQTKSERGNCSALYFCGENLTLLKAVAIPHIAAIANVLQMAIQNKANEAHTTWDKRRYRPGDVHAAGGYVHAPASFLILTCNPVLPFYRA